MPELRKMKRKELKEECQMWRNVWQWIPPEVRYYASRTGQQIGLTARNYKRHLGVLLGTYWDLTEIELGVSDKVYDPISGEYFFERKIIRTKLGGIIEVQWIKERIPESELIPKEDEAEPEEKTDTEV